MDVDRNFLLNVDFYKNVFGDWQKFERLVNDDVELALQNSST
jgi:hypothetical protein